MQVHDLPYSLVGLLFILLALILLHLYWWMLGIGVLLVSIDELVEAYIERMNR